MRFMSRQWKSHLFVIIRLLNDGKLKVEDYYAAIDAEIKWSDKFHKRYSSNHTLSLQEESR